MRQVNVNLRTGFDVRGEALDWLIARAWKKHVLDPWRGPVIRNLFANVLLAREAVRYRESVVGIRVSMRYVNTRGRGGDEPWMLEHLCKVAGAGQMESKGNYLTRHSLFTPAADLPYFPVECLRLEPREDCVLGAEGLAPEDVQRMRLEMEVINDAIARYDLECPGDASDARGRSLHRPRYAWAIERGYYTRMQTSLDLQLCRHFRVPTADRPYTDGGRLYGGWWVDYKKAARGEVKLNGDLLVESDYRYILPALAYSAAGHVLSEDPYDFGDGLRDAWKGMIGAMLSARAPLAGWPKSAIALQAKYRFGYALDLVHERHSRIADYFGSAWGMRSQRLESDLTVSAMLHCIKAGIPVLPVHDALWSSQANKIEVMAIMLHTAREHGHQLKVK